MKLYGGIDLHSNNSVFSINGLSHRNSARLLTFQRRRQQMAKHKQTAKAPALSQKQVDLARSTINHSALGALVTSKIFYMRVVKAKKGKGSFNRKAKHSGKECYQIAA